MHVLDHVVKRDGVERLRERFGAKRPSATSSRATATPSVFGVES